VNPIYLIVGPPAVGKSTTSRALAAHLPKSIHIPVDDIRHMVVSGLVLPGPEWAGEMLRQITLARTIVVEMALSYHRAGFAVVIDDFFDPYHLAEYSALLALPNIHRIVLFPDQAEAHRRCFGREGDGPGRAYIDGGIHMMYGFLNAAMDRLVRDGWMIVDTTRLSVDATVEAILEQERSINHLAASVEDVVSIA
jgi:energy-coupling factor transporter ATP-binding protein EcfA2